MATISITNQTLTISLIVDGATTVIRKDNCKVQAFGDVVRITDYTGTIYEFLYSDCVSPSEASGADLRDAIEAFLNTAGGGSSGLTSIESTTLDVTEADGVATVDLPYEAIPLAGTETGANVSGDIVVNGGIRIKSINANEDAFNSFYLDDGGVQMQADGGGGIISSASLNTAEFAVSTSAGGPAIRDNGFNLAAVTGGANDPSSTPDRIGAVYISSDGPKIFISVGVDSSADWKQIFPSL